MRHATFAVLVVLWVGCGDGGEDEPSLVGAWVAPGDGCAYGMTFEPDGAYFEGTSCGLEGGDVGVEVYGGTYTTSGDEITLKQTHGTCAEAEPLTERLAYELDGDKLRVGTAAGTVVLSRAPEGDVTGQATYGCYGEDGAFTPSPIAEL